MGILSTVNIPESTRSIGTTTTAGASVPVGVTGLHIRLVAANWLTASYEGLTGTMTIQHSLDNGSTWFDDASTPFDGQSVTPPKFGLPGGLLPDLATTFPGGTGRQMRGVLTLSKSVSLGFKIDVLDNT